MILSTQSQVMRAIKSRLMTALSLPESRVFVTSDPNMAEAMDYAIQISPIGAGAVNDFNRSGLGLMTERLGITTMVRSMSDQANKQNRRMTGVDRGVLYRQDEMRQALIQNNLGGLLQIDLRFVTSGASRPHPRTEGYIMAMDTFVCSYAYPWPTGNLLRYGWSATTPDWEDLSEEVGYSGFSTFTGTAFRSSTDPSYVWFAIASSITPTFYAGIALTVFTNEGSITVGGVAYTLWRSPSTLTTTTQSYRVE